MALSACRLAYTDGGDGFDGDSNVAITVLEGGMPAQGLTVLFHDATGALLSATQVGPDGVASGRISAGGMVTVVRFSSDSSAVVLETIGGLEPGATLSVGSTVDPWQYAGDLDITLSESFAGADHYVVDWGCDYYDFSDPTESSYAYFGRACVPGGTASAIAVAYDAEGNPLGHSGMAGIALDPDTTGQVTLPAWNSDWETATLSLSNLPRGASWLKSELFETVAGQRLFYTYADSGDFTEPVSLDLRRPSGFGDGVILTPRVYFESGAESGMVIHEARTAATESIPLDMSNTLGEILAVPFGQTEGGAEIEIVSLDDLSEADALLVGLQFQTLSSEVRWRATLPSTATAFTVPELPDFLSNARIDEVTSLDFTQAMVIEADFIDGFSDFASRWVGNVFEEVYLPDSYVIRYSKPPGGFAYDSLEL